MLKKMSCQHPLSCVFFVRAVLHLRTVWNAASLPQYPREQVSPVAMEGGNLGTWGCHPLTQGPLDLVGTLLEPMAFC